MLKILLYVIGSAIYFLNTRANFEFWRAMFIDPLRALVAAVLWPITMPAVGAVFAAQDIMARLEGGE